MKSVCVFCSSQTDVSPFFYEEISVLAKELVEKQFNIIYGGATDGLMGHLADEAISCGGQVMGILPNNFAQEAAHNGLSELRIVKDLGERKLNMLQESDGFIAFPGGIGTLDEVIEMICYKSLQYHDKPIVLVNYMNFWVPFLQMLDLMREQRMISGPMSDYFQIVDSSVDAVTYLKKIL